MSLGEARAVLGEFLGEFEFGFDGRRNSSIRRASGLVQAVFWVSCRAIGRHYQIAASVVAWNRPIAAHLYCKPHLGLRFPHRAAESDRQYLADPVALGKLPTSQWELGCNGSCLVMRLHLTPTFNNVEEEQGDEFALRIQQNQMLLVNCGARGFKRLRFHA